MTSWASAHRYELLLGGSVALAAGWWLTRPGLPGGRKAALTEEELVKVLHALSEEFFGIFSEMAQVVQSMTKKLEAAQSKLTPEQFAEILMQRGLQEKLEAAQDQVFTKLEVRATDVEAAQEAMADSPAVQVYIDGLAKMHDDCFRGVLPLMPGVEVPASLTPAVLLQHVERICEEKHRRISAAVKGWYAENGTPEAGKAPAIPPPQLTQAIQEAYDASEACVLEGLGVPMVVFKNALAVSLRNADFAEQKLAVDRAFQERFKAAMMPPREAAAPAQVAANGAERGA